MTKQPPFATKLRLSRLCRGIIALAVIKLCVLVAIVADIPLPELRWETSSQQQAQQQAQPADSTASTTLVLGKPERSLLATSVAQQAAQDSASPMSAQANEPPSAAQNNEPQGSAAAAAAARLRPLGSRAAITMPASSLTKEKEDSPIQADAPIANLAAPAQAVASLTAPASASTAANTPAATGAAATASPEVAEAAPLLSTGVETQNTADSPSWWHNMLQLTSLPVPQLGVSQVAHAASLDTPPAPAVAPAGGSSPFTPPAQQVMRGQDANGNPIPPRSTTARPIPSASSGLPQTSPAPTNTVDPMVTAVPPPTPNVNAYVPPEDPNRKQQELARREQEILALKQQMEQRLKELESAENRVKGMIKNANDVESKKVAGLIAVYANMKPKQAAQTLQSLDERVAVKILTGLTPKQAGEILSYADPKTTAKLTELMTRMQTQP